MSKRKAADKEVRQLPPFENLRAHLEKLQKDEKLVDLLSEAWDSDDMRRCILSGLGTSSWAPVSDPNEFLKYDWDVQNDEESDDDDDDDDEGNNDDEESEIKLHFRGNNVQLGCYSSVKKVDAKKCSGGSYISWGDGCPECSGDEVYHFEMERKLDGTTRLKVQYYVSCRCGCMQGDDSDHCEEMEYIALPRK